MQELSAAVLATDHPHTISSIPSSAAIKSQLFRADLKENPRPPIPDTHEDFMSLDLPTMFTQTADGKRFLDKRGWMDETRTKSMCLWLSDWGCDVLKTHPVWMLDGTTSASHLATGYLDFPARLLHLTSPSHLDTGHFKLIQL